MKPNSANIKRKKKYKLHHKNEMLSKLTNFGNEWNDKKSRSGNALMTQMNAAR